jgi:outer membrane protein OmpA-like peptidoglycan-associated protein
VRTTVSPLDAKVAQLDKKTHDKTTELASGLETVENDLSRTKERLSDTDAKAIAANERAQRAEGKAVKAGLTADQARELAEKGLDRAILLERAMEERDKLELRAQKTVLFRLNSCDLTPEGKETVDELAAQLSSLELYAVELEGFTDRTGNRALNLSLSQKRAEAVARYLAIHHKVPLRRVHVLGAGAETPAADNSRRTGRARNRRVEVRVFAPGVDAVRTSKQSSSAGAP